MEIIIGIVLIAIVVWMLTKGSSDTGNTSSEHDVKIDVNWTHATIQPNDELRNLAHEWDGLLDREDVMVIDTETTGLDRNSEVIEVAVFNTAGGVLYHALSLPEGSIPREASNIHGLTRQKLKQMCARSWTEIYPELMEILGEAEVVLGWNVNFDMQMLRQTARRHGLSMPWIECQDLLRDYREYMGESPQQGRHTLTNVAQRCGVSIDGDAHRASADCALVFGIMKSVQAMARVEI